MTSRTKAQAGEDEAPATEQAAGEAQPEQQPEADAPLCGKPHHLPMLAGHVTCQRPAEDPDREPGTPEHEHRHEDGDAIYTWS